MTQLDKAKNIRGPVRNGQALCFFLYMRLFLNWSGVMPVCSLKNRLK